MPRSSGAMIPVLLPREIMVSPLVVAAPEPIVFPRRLLFWGQDDER
jgi:hypothetical protein